MIRIILILLILIGLNSCYTKNNNTSINLNKDLFHFSSKMNNNDTIVLNVNLSNCEWEEYETNYIIKKNNKISLKITNENYYDGKKDFKSVKYEYSNLDSLNFEDFFLYLAKKNVIKDRNHFISIIHKLDTLYFYSKSLNDLLDNLGYYRLITIKYYPDEERYKIPEPPKEPKRLTPKIEFDIIETESGDTIKI